MAEPRVETYQFIDPRIEPQPTPVYDYVIAPTQNQYYRVPASGLSNSNITFNNLTTLGIDRAYLDTFEIEITADFEFTVGDYQGADSNDESNSVLIPRPSDWTFQSFPFNTCCDEARVNINGGAFFSQPMCYVRAKERYMDQMRLAKCYENVCPIHKPLLQSESGRNYVTNSTTANSDYSNVMQSAEWNQPVHVTTRAETSVGGAIRCTTQVDHGYAVPTRYGHGMHGFMQSETIMNGGFNNSIVDLGAPRAAGGYENYYREGTKTKVRVTWREPLFVSPFSSRYDATYGRPLYNITSMDFSFTLQDLGNMIRIANYTCDGQVLQEYVKSYTVNIASAFLCYQVMTIPTSRIVKPVTTIVPYRRFIPYITDYNATSSGQMTRGITSEGAEGITINSGVYTLNEIPTAIWVFCAPSKRMYQQNPESDVNYTGVELTCLNRGNWDSNKLFAYLREINITLANTTQILNTAKLPDLYRIAKANGCEDSYWSWSGKNICWPMNDTGAHKMYYGAGSVLRLKPGVDIIIPDRPLIPGANADNMVLQVTATFDIPPHARNINDYSLWLLFEYVGVAAISPGQCEITMNPLGKGEPLNNAPVLSATSHATEGALEGMGFWDTVKKYTGIARQLAKDSGIVSKLLKRVGSSEWGQNHPLISGQVNALADYAASKGYGAPGLKRARGGKVMGESMDDWI